MKYLVYVDYRCAMPSRDPSRWEIIESGKSVPKPGDIFTEYVRGDGCIKFISTDFCSDVDCEHKGLITQVEKYTEERAQELGVRCQDSKI